MALVKITGERKRKLLSAMKQAYKMRDKGGISFYAALGTLVSERDRSIIMDNLMWADRGFMSARSDGR